HGLGNGDEEVVGLLVDGRIGLQEYVSIGAHPDGPLRVICFQLHAQARHTSSADTLRGEGEPCTLPRGRGSRGGSAAGTVPTADYGNLPAALLHANLWTAEND